jgi:hypothetical protein
MESVSGACNRGGGPGAETFRCWRHPEHLSAYNLQEVRGNQLDRVLPVEESGKPPVPSGQKSFHFVRRSTGAVATAIAFFLRCSS